MIRMLAPRPNVQIFRVARVHAEHRTVHEDDIRVIDEALAAASGVNRGP